VFDKKVGGKEKGRLHSRRSGNPVRRMGVRIFFCENAMVEKFGIGAEGHREVFFEGILCKESEGGEDVRWGASKEREH